MTSVSDLHRVAVIDDDENVREQYGIQVELWERSPIVFRDQSIGALESVLKRTQGVDAGISDYKLRTSGYALFNGAELVSKWVQQGVPGLLCTRFGTAEITQIRPYLRYIPQILDPELLSPDSIEFAFARALEEIDGVFRDERKPWRAQVTFLDEDESNPDLLLVELPSWDGTDRIWVSRKSLPLALAAVVAPGMRTFAKANLGTDNGLSLYLAEWEVNVS